MSKVPSLIEKLKELSSFLPLLNLVVLVVMLVITTQNNFGNRLDALESSFGNRAPLGTPWKAVLEAA